MAARAEALGDTLEREHGVQLDLVRRDAGLVVEDVKKATPVTTALSHSRTAARAPRSPGTKGASWREVGEALGVSHTEAQRRYK
jgi:hypothetical protein